MPGTMSSLAAACVMRDLSKTHQCPINQPKIIIHIPPLLRMMTVLTSALRPEPSLPRGQAVAKV